MDNDGQRTLKARMNRIAGQVAGIERMIDDNRYCMDILNQIAAVRSALDNVGVQLLTDHLEHCVLGQATTGGGVHAHPQAQGKSPEALLAEVQAALSRFLR